MRSLRNDYEERRDRRENRVQTVVFVGAFLALAAVLIFAISIRSNQRAEQRRIATATVRVQRTATAQARAERTATAMDLLLPAFAGTPVPHPLAVLSPVNVARMEEAARWGEGWIRTMDWSPRGRIVAVGTVLGVRFYDAHVFEERRFLRTPSMVRELAFSPDGSLLAIGLMDGTVHLWHVPTVLDPVVGPGDVLAVLEGHSDTVAGLAFSPDGGLLASGSVDRTIRLWDVSDLLLLDEPTLLGLDGGSGATAGGNLPSGAATTSTGKTGGLDRPFGEGGPRLGEIASVQVLEGHRAGVHSVAFSPDGGLLASGSLDGTVRLWDISTVLTVRDGPAEAVTVLGKHADWVLSVAFSPDGDILASGSCRERNVSYTCIAGEIVMWDVEAALALNNGASAEGTSTGPLPEESAELVVGVLEGHSAGVQSVAFSPDGSLLASGSWDGTMQLWDVVSATKFGVGADPVVRVLKGHAGAISKVVFSPDGAFLASGASDGTVRLWGVVR